MRLIVRPRRAGKTEKLLQIAVEYSATIVCFDRQEAQRLEHLAKEWELDIPKPTPFYQLGNQRRGLQERFVFDNLDLILARMVNGQLIIAATATGPIADIA